MTKRILVCADDYGQTLPISQAILALINKKRLTAVSCIVTGTDWPQHAELLKPWINKVDIGLHFNLTHLQPLSSIYHSFYGNTFPTLSRLLLKSQLRLLKKAPIQAEFVAQYQQFKAMMSKEPDFIDGHQHVHQFPIIREAIIESLLQKPGPKPFIRLVNPKSIFEKGRISKKLIIRLSGSVGLRSLLNQHQFAFNQSFTGIYDFTKASQYRSYVQSFLQEIDDQGLMMCHPGLPDQTEAWPLSFSRPLEYAYLASDAFLEDLVHAKIMLERFQH
jgi:predicted glycoside hydrolase/deacetylase ChbG (UPF0249 family)